MSGVGRQTISRRKKLGLKEERRTRGENGEIKRRTHLGPEAWQPAVSHPGSRKGRYTERKKRFKSPEAKYTYEK